MMSHGFRCNQRAAILVDSANVFMTSLAMGVKIDHAKLLERLDDREIVRSILYHVEIDPEREEGFLRRVQSLGFEVKCKPIRTYPDGKAKADMDVDITVDAIALSEKCDVITLVTGDGDYVPLVLYLKAMGVKTEAMAFERNISHRLRMAVDEFIPITTDILQPTQGVMVDRP